MYNLRILHWNSNGIAKKINELQAFISTHNINIILLSETRLNPNIKLKIPNFTTYRTDMPPKHGIPHGGTAVLVHRNITHLPVKLNTQIQSTSIKIQLNNTEMLITSVYKPPKSPLSHNDLDILTSSADWMVAAGDLNAKHPLWNSHTINQAGISLYQHASSNDYSILAPDSPTHFPTNPHHRPDVLDIALLKTNHHTQINNFNCLSSDHNPIVIEFSSSPISSTPPSPTRFINWKKFTNQLSTSNISPNPNTNSPSEIDLAIENYTKLIQHNLELSSFSPKFKQKRKIPDYIIKEIQNKNQLRRQWQLNRDPALKRALNAKVKNIRLILTTHRNDEWDKHLDATNLIPNSIFKINKCLLNKRPAIHPLKSNNNLIYSSRDKAEIFADSLENQFTPNPGPDLLEVNNSSSTYRNASHSPDFFTTPGYVATLIKHTQEQGSRRRPDNKHSAKTSPPQAYLTHHKNFQRLPSPLLLPCRLA